MVVGSTVDFISYCRRRKCFRRTARRSSEVRTIPPQRRKRHHTLFSLEISQDTKACTDPTSASREDWMEYVVLISAPPCLSMAATEQYLVSEISIASSTD